jgi:diguanylate cyclase (GGDEF)-like protein
MIDEILANDILKSCDLVPMEEHLIRLRLGVDCEPYTFTQLMTEFGVTKERIRQLEVKVLRKLVLEYEEYAIVDVLTGIFNRRWLEKMLVRLMERSRIDGQALSLLLMDIDHFKKYNDTYGHAAGDRALFAAVRSLKDGMRPGDMIARYGGDEFVALIPNTDVSACKRVGERLRELVKEAKVYSKDRKPLPSVTISVGVAQMKAQDTPETFIAAADAALYVFKENRIELTNSLSSYAKHFAAEDGRVGGKSRS